MVKHHCLGLLLLLTGLGLFPDARQDGLERFEFQQVHMGTEFRIVLYAPNRDVAKKAADAAFARIASLDASMSDYKPASELMQLCKKAGGEPTPVSADLFDVLERSLAIAQLTDRAFDITVGPVVRLWRRARRTMMLPDADELARARALVGIDQVVLDAKGRTVQLKAKGILLDLGGIAKGYAAQAALEVLRQHGIRHALVAASGDIVVGDAPPGSKGWRIAVASPKGPTSATLLLTNAAVSTSGDTEQYVEIDGKRYSHIVDPKTGLGLTRRMSVTVIARDGATADALATALCVLGPEVGLPIVEAQKDVAAYYQLVGDKGIQEMSSKRFDAYRAAK